MNALSSVWSKIGMWFRPRHVRAEHKMDEATDFADSVDQKARETIVGIDTSVDPDNSYPGIC